MSKRIEIHVYPVGSSNLLSENFSDNPIFITELLESLSFQDNPRRVVIGSKTPNQCEMLIDGRRCCNSKQTGQGNFSYCYQHRYGSVAHADAKPAYKPCYKPEVKSKASDREFCKATTKAGHLCTNSSKEGNYGFCGIHRR